MGPRAIVPEQLLLDAGVMPPAPARRPVRVRSARSRNRAEAWAYDLDRQRDYALAMARSDAERVEVDAAYKAERARGPDFTRYHVASRFAEPPETGFDRKDANKILTAFDVIRRGMVRHCRVPRRRPGAGDEAPAMAVEHTVAPPESYKVILKVFLRYALQFGQVFPKLETIAREAAYSVRTVQRAIDWLQRFGFLDKMRRVVRERTGLGGVRCRQTSNAYRVGLPTGLGRLAQSVFRRIVYGRGASGSSATQAVAGTTRHTCHPFSDMTDPPTDSEPLGEGFQQGFQWGGAGL
jgi:hypothetical protein